MIRVITIYLFKQQGCSHCAAAAREAAKFRALRPEVLVVELDESMREHQIDGFTAKATPAYLFKINQEAAHQHTGVLTASALSKLSDQLLGA